MRIIYYEPIGYQSNLLIFFRLFYYPTSRIQVIQFGFSQNPERNQWTRLPLSLNWDKKAKFSFGIDYPGGMTETERAKWQVKQLIALSQLVSELYQ